MELARFRERLTNRATAIDWARAGDIDVRNVSAMVAEPGKLAVNLLAMRFIGCLKRFETRGGELVLDKCARRANSGVHYPKAIGYLI